MTEKFQLATISIFILVGVLTGTLALNAPLSFPVGTKFEVHEGESLRSTSIRLKDEHYITSSILFRAWVSVLGKDKSIGLGVYEFDKSTSLGGVIAKFLKGPDEPLLSVTIPEGDTTQEIADAFKKVLPAISTNAFTKLVADQGFDGYLFPSTYYLLPSYEEKDVVTLMKATFDKEYALHFQNEQFPKTAPTLQKVLSLAAILENEAKTPEDMKLVAGILEKRLASGMRLQVDAAPGTYSKAGLPAIPIANPGLIAIDAVFHPTASAYLYYLTGNDGKMYYAKTFEEHKKNIQKYLR
jgi:UPF0755 protein